MSSNRIALTFIIYAVLLLVIIRIIQLLNKPIGNSIIFKGFEYKLPNLMKQTVSKLAIAHSSITTTPTVAFTTNVYSHWALLLMFTSSTNKRVLISPGENKNIIVHNLKPKSFKPIGKSDSNYESFIDADGFMYVYNELETYKTHSNTKLVDVINSMYRIVSKEQYNILTNNCHYHVSATANQYIRSKHKIEYIRNPIKLVLISICEILDPSMPFFYSC